MGQLEHKEPFGVYVHWPFCLAKCPYCDFNSHVRREPDDGEGFASAVCAELDYLAARTGARVLDSVFFGGGTPSLMTPSEVAAVLETIDRTWGIPASAEITLEANPTSAEAEKFAGYRAVGVNRLSVGVQALNDKDLAALGRQHTADEALAAYHLAAKLFARTSFDLIYARPGQSVDDWRQELARALGEQNGHMSLYQLTIEPDTVFARRHANGTLTVPGEDQAADLYEVTRVLTADAGLHAYEVSNHARPGHESRHNLIYWRYGEYVGAGPGAHSRLVGEDGRRTALVMHKHSQTWQKHVSAMGHGIECEAMISPADAGLEALMMGLRLSEGIDLTRHARLGGAPVDQKACADLINEGYLTRSNCSVVAATEKGRLVLNTLATKLAGAK